MTKLRLANALHALHAQGCCQPARPDMLSRALVALMCMSLRSHRDMRLLLQLLSGVPAAQHYCRAHVRSHNLMPCKGPASISWHLEVGEGGQDGEVPVGDLAGHGLAEVRCGQHQLGQGSLGGQLLCSLQLLQSCLGLSLHSGLQFSVQSRRPLRHTGQ